MCRNNYLLIILILLTSGISAQTTDLFRVEALNLPFSKSDNEINRYRVLVQAPIPLDKERNNLFVITLEYRYVDVNIKDAEDVLAFNGNLVTATQQIDGYLGYVWKYNKDWRIGARAGVKIQSDFEGSLISDDFVYDFGLYVIKDKKKDTSAGNKPYRFIAGLSYSTTPGRSFPLPFLNYYKEFRPNWTYTLGVPKSNVRYYLNNSHKDALQAFATIDNIYSNIQQNFAPLSTSQNPDNLVAESIQETIVLLGLGYEHYFTKNLLFYGYAAHSVYNDFRLEDGNGDKIYKINTENSPYFRAGIKFKY
jgi:hypothetical protein